jgi:serine/threonine protein kinase
MLCKEALLWRQLSHPHILPFLGTDTETFATRNALCLVSPWMQNGTLKQYITSPSYNVDNDQSRLVICFVRRTFALALTLTTAS